MCHVTRPMLDWTAGFFSELKVQTSKQSAVQQTIVSSDSNEFNSVYNIEIYFFN